MSGWPPRRSISAANGALCRLLAHELGIPLGNVRIATGATARRKVVAVTGVEAATVRSRWPGLAL